MAAGKDFNATDYIQHHLTFLTAGDKGGGFWAITALTVALAVGAAFVLRRIGWI